MSLAAAWSVAMIGLDGRIVEVEAHIGSGAAAYRHGRPG